ELADEQRNVLDALPKRRNPHGDDVDAVVEVLPHAALGHRCGKVHVGGADDPHVDLDPAVGAELLDFSLLEDPQQLELHVQRDALDLVEEPRAPARQLDLADTVVHRAGERAALVPEELALEQRVRERRAVDRDEAAALALALEVDRAGRQLLARSGFAVDEHGGVVLGEHADGLEDLVHDPVAAHHVRERVPVGELAAQVVDLVQQAPLLEDLLGGEENLLFLEGLRDVVARALLDGLDRTFDAGVAGDHDDVEIGPAIADLTGQPDAVRAGDLEIHHRERELLLGQEAQRFGGVWRRGDRVPLRGVELLELPANEGVVVDDENAGFHLYPRKSQH